MASRGLDDPLALLGHWAFHRVIDDRRAAEQSTVDGETELATEGQRIRWSEAGTLYWRDQEVPVSRVLYLERRDGGWFVTFDDGRDFHPWSPGDSVEHLCGADVYRGCVVGPAEEGMWSVEWSVSGPTKDYTMTTVLRRAPKR